MSKPTIIDADDWVMVWKGEECVFTGHSITPTMLLEALGIEFDSAYLEPSEEGEQEELWNVLYGDPTLTEMKKRLDDAEAKGFSFGRH